MTKTPKMTSLAPALVQLAVVDERRGLLGLAGHQATELTLLHHGLLQEDIGQEDEENCKVDVGDDFSPRYCSSGRFWPQNFACSNTG